MRRRRNLFREWLRAQHAKYGQTRTREESITN
jgi:hypothetical protein